MTAYVPIIDLAGPPDAVAATIDDACRKSGFLVVTGHGVDPALVERMHDVTLALFAERDEWKQQWQPPVGVEGLRGMHLVASNVSAAEDVATAPDLCEMFTMSRLGEPGVADRAHLDGAPEGWRSANIWPDRPAGLREVWLDWYAAMEALATRLLELFARGLGLDEHHFDHFVDQHVTNLTANHYPPVEGAPSPDQFRKGPHSDWGTLTILYQDGTGGLEVVDRRSGGNVSRASPRASERGVWIDVPVLPGSFVVNIGDLMATWTNGRWHSTKHRVRVPSPERRSVARVSIPFFHHPNWDAVIECLPGCVEDGETPLFPPVTAGEYLLRKVTAAYT